jgi:hypothetical protein
VHLETEDAVEDALMQALSALRKAGYRLEVLDLTAVCKLARPAAVGEVDGEQVPVVKPRDPGAWKAARDFDMAMFEAGLTRFIRAPLPGDVIAPGVVLVGRGG